MIHNIKKHIFTFFLVASTLSALASDPTKDALVASSSSGANECINLTQLLGRTIAEFLPKFSDLVILSSAGKKG